MREMSQMRGKESIQFHGRTENGPTDDQRAHCAAARPSFALSLCQTFCFLRHPLLPRRHQRSALPTRLAFDQLLAFQHVQPPPHCRLQQPTASTSHFDIATTPTRQVSTPHTSIFVFPLSSSNTARSRSHEGAASFTSRTTNSGLTC